MDTAGNVFPPGRGAWEQRDFQHQAIYATNAAMQRSPPLRSAGTLPLYFTPPRSRNSKTI